MRGGGSKAVWNFSENSSVLEGGCFPKQDLTMSVEDCGERKSVGQNCKQVQEKVLRF